MRPAPQHPFEVQFTVDGKAVVVQIYGKINEDADLGPTLNYLLSRPFEEVRFDLVKVTGINSCGVRDWLLFMQRLQAVQKVRFFRVPESFIEQAAVVTGLLGRPGTPVESFHVPYSCTGCRASKSVLTELAQVQSAAGKRTPLPQQPKCDKCGQALEFDADEAEYFTFLTNLTPTKAVG